MGIMSRDLRPGPHSRPTDELHSAEDTLGILQRALHPISSDDLSKQTPCTEFDVTRLTEHLLTSISGIGGMVGAQIPERDESDSVERQIVLAARPALDAWHRHGLDGTVPFGKSQMPAKSACGILSIEFLVHAWDYAVAVGHELDAPSRCPSTCWIWRTRPSGRNSAARRGSTIRWTCPTMPALWRSSSHSPDATRPGNSRRRFGRAADHPSQPTVGRILIEARVPHGVELQRDQLPGRREDAGLRGVGILAGNSLRNRQQEVGARQNAWRQGEIGHADSHPAGDAERLEGPVDPGLADVDGQVWPA